MRGIYWVTANGKWHTDLANGEQIWQISTQLFGKISAVLVLELVKLNGKFFAESCEPATFRFAQKSLVKSTPGTNPTKTFTFFAIN